LGLPGRGLAVEGYEIHLGTTAAQGAGGPAFILTSRNGKPAAVHDGWVSASGLVMGTYVHGLFDADGFRRAFVATLLGAAPQGSEDLPAWSYQAFQEAQFDRLAENLRRHLDLDRLFKLFRSV
jgi:adenosylcobyric acid synthase